MGSSMQNISVGTTQFFLVWLEVAGILRYLYAILAFVLYIIAMSASALIVYVTVAEESLHKPMYIFISSLVLNVMFGCSACLPKLSIDWLLNSSSISLTGCLFQAFCIQSYVVTEIGIFTAMAFDRYLAVEHPLRYSTLMTNIKSIKSLQILWVFILVSTAVGMSLTAQLTFCGVNINNVFCEALSLQQLACGDTAINTIYGTVWTLFVVTSCVLVVIFSYVRTILICLKLSREASQKATHTLVTHVLAFSTFMVCTLFFTFRYRLYIGSFPPVLQVIIIMVAINVVILNPMIYGIRTEALRVKIGFSLQKCGLMKMIKTEVDF